MIQPLSIDIICQLNQKLTGNETDEMRKSKVGSCLSSYYYYDNAHDQISSIINSIIKNHYFVDGNKRTGVLVLYLLAEFNNLTLVDNNVLKDVIIDIANNHYSAEKISSLIFEKSNDYSK